MHRKLKRVYGKGHLHYITFSCWQRRALLGTSTARNAFVQALDEVRKKYGFSLVGFVVMPEHVHLVIGESSAADPSAVIHSLKLRVFQKMRKMNGIGANADRKSASEEHLWQRRFYDFNVYSAVKLKEKLEYMHRNPITRKLVEDPKDWIWSSYSAYSGSGTTIIEIDFVQGVRHGAKAQPKAKLKINGGEIKVKIPTFAPKTRLCRWRRTSGTLAQIGCVLE